MRRTGCKILAYPVSSRRCDARIQSPSPCPNTSTAKYGYTCDAPAPSPVYATFRQAGASHVAESVVLSSVRRTGCKFLAHPASSCRCDARIQVTFALPRPVHDLLSLHVRRTGARSRVCHVSPGRCVARGRICCHVIRASHRLQISRVSQYDNGSAQPNLAAGSILKYFIPLALHNIAWLPKSTSSCPCAMHWRPTWPPARICAGKWRPPC